MRTIPNPILNGKCTLKGEIQSKCPVTGQDDYYQFTITYQPEDKIIEIYSLKEFLKQYEPQRKYQEEITQEIQYELTRNLQCPVKVVLEDKSPGIQLTTEVI